MSTVNVKEQASPPGSASTGEVEIYVRTATKRLATEDDASTVVDYASTDPASTTLAGLVEQATQAEVDAGSDTERYITPATLAATTVSTTDAGVMAVRKASAGTIPKGSGVYIVGWDGGNEVVTVEEADADTAVTMAAIGVAPEPITNTANHNVVTAGKLEGIDTSSWDAGDDLYVAVGGGLTDIRPTGVNEIQKIGTVSYSDASAGVIAVFGAGRSNAVPNLPENYVWQGDGDGVAQQATRASVVDGAGAVMHSDVAEAAGFLLKTASETYEAVLINRNASTDPGVGDDSGDGYSVGSRWYNTTDNKEWVCLNNTLGAAIWKDTTVPTASSFGGDYDYQVSEGSSTNATATYISKVAITLPAITGTMKLTWYAEIGASTKDKEFGCRVQNTTDVTTYGETVHEVQAAGQSVPISGEVDVGLTGSSKTVQIQFNAPNGDVTATIERARLSCFQVS